MPSVVPMSLGGEAGGKEQAGNWGSVVCQCACLSAGNRSLKTQSRHQAGPGNGKALCKQHRVEQGLLLGSVSSTEASNVHRVLPKMKESAKYCRLCDQVNTNKCL